MKLKPLEDRIVVGRDDGAAREAEVGCEDSGRGQGVTGAEPPGAQFADHRVSDPVAQRSGARGHGERELDRSGGARHQGTAAVRAGALEVLSTPRAERALERAHDGTDQPLGQITEAQLQFLVDSMVEESSEDQDYYIDEPTLDYLADRGADAELMELLRAAISGRKHTTIRWAA